MSSTASTLTKRQVWLAAARPRTLPLALSSILLGTFLAAAAHSLNWPIAILCILTATLLQILSNLANDYGDSVHGADHVERAGPQRAVQTGAIARETMKRAVILLAALSAVSGLALVVLAFGVEALPLVGLFLLLGAAAVWAAISYTAGNKPYGYAGLGDLFVLIFFGWVGTMGTYFLQTHSFTWDLFLPASACGLLAVAVLNVNNIRDIKSDEMAGKYSIPVRIGPEKARVYHWGLLAAAMLCALIYVLLRYSSPWQLLFLLTLPLIIRNGLSVQRIYEPMQLNPLLKQLSLTTLAFVLIFGLGQLL